MLARMALLERLPSLTFWKRASSSAAGEAPLPGAVHVLMVCTGNICRSPTAEGVLRARQCITLRLGDHQLRFSPDGDPLGKRIGYAMRQGLDVRRPGQGDARATFLRE